MTLHLQHYSIQYHSADSPIIENIDMAFQSGWTGISGPNGSGKTTMLLGISHMLSPETALVSGAIHGPESRYYCAQKSDFPPKGSDDFQCALLEQDNFAGRLMSLFELEYDMYYRWETLSFGERKRFQLATALWLEPEVLLIDEPTNHLDEKASKLILNGLKEYMGIGVIVSHDRNFMDELCQATVFLDNSQAHMFPGGVSKGIEELDKLKLSVKREYTKAKEEVSNLLKEAVQRRNVAADQQRRRSKRGLAIKDHDARFKKNLARLTGKDGVGGKLLRQMDGRIAQAKEKLNNISPEKTRKTGVSLNSTNISRDYVFHLPEQKIELNEQKHLLVPDLYLKPGQKICLTGENGCGKTTLIRQIIGNQEIAKLLYIPQNLAKQDEEKLIEQLRILNSKELGDLLSTFSRLGSNPNSLLENEFLSPGEARKLMLSFGIQRAPELIILDEPTNHLDLTSTMALEQALQKLPCAMLIVSHDQRFREAICTIEWNIDNGRLAEVV